MCSVVLYYHVYPFKKNETIRNGQRDITVKHTEKQLRQRNVGKCNGSENKNDTVKLSFLLNYENPVIHSYLYFHAYQTEELNKFFPEMYSYSLSSYILQLNYYKLNCLYRNPVLYWKVFHNFHQHMFFCFLFFVFQFHNYLILPNNLYYIRIQVTGLQYYKVAYNIIPFTINIILVFLIK